MTAPKPVTATKFEGQYGANNCAVFEDDGVITIRIDSSKRLRPSQSGTTTIVGTTSGAVQMPSGVKVSVNAYIKE